MFVLSNHAAREIEKRQILPVFIEIALRSPDDRRPDPSDPGLTRSFKAIAEFGGRVLRVVHRPSEHGIFVVTAHWDRGARL
jgi:Domain of unknown function (DUF4258)